MRQTLGCNERVMQSHRQHAQPLGRSGGREQRSREWVGTPFESMTAEYSNPSGLG